jgi:hypothetical protein
MQTDQEHHTPALPVVPATSMENDAMKKSANPWLLDAHTDETYTALVAKMINMLPQRNNWCVDFGAWDGLVGSDSRNLVVNHGFSAVLIEGNKDRFRDLQRNYAGNKNVFTFNKFVGFGADDGLDAILKTTPIPQDFDFLVTDIDGNDYHVWAAVANYHPKIVCIEFNPTIPPEVRFIQPADPSVNQGSSLSSLVELGAKKGYELISVISVNAFFVNREYYPLFGIEDNRVELVWTKRDRVTYIFSGYDGRIFLRGYQKLPWHEYIPMAESKMQCLPSFLQKYPFTRRRRIAYTCLTNPLSLIPKILRRIASCNPFGKGNP